MEIISSLSFKHRLAPEDDLIKFLMDIILSMSDEDQSIFSTRDSETCQDESLCQRAPLVQSSLLQLMIEHR